MKVQDPRQMTKDELIERNLFLEQFYEKYTVTRSKFKERVKELKCIYRITRTIVENDRLDDLLEKITQIIPEGWQFPELTSARIVARGKVFESDNFVESRYMLSEAIILDDTEIGQVEVFYRDSASVFGNDPFLKEEKDLMDAIASIIGLVIKQHEIKENKDLIRQQLLHADRLATIGQLAAGVAHELNEPLTNILGFAQLIDRDKSLDSDSRKDLGRIEEASLYARKIIQKLMEFSRQTIPNVMSFDLADVVDDAIYFLESRCQRKGIAIHKHFEKNIILLADPDQIKQVVTNLCLNAMQAMKNGGELTIETVRQDDNGVLVVSDTGEGILDENVGQIFMPFFTTKDVGEGTGLGLSVVYGIVKAYSGNIKVSSCIGRGTRFDVIFPLKQGEME